MFGKKIFGLGWLKIWSSSQTNRVTRVWNPLVESILRYGAWSAHFQSSQSARETWSPTAHWRPPGSVSDSPGSAGKWSCFLWWILWPWCFPHSMQEPKLLGSVFSIIRDMRDKTITFLALFSRMETKKAFPFPPEWIAGKVNCPKLYGHHKKRLRM